MLTEQILNLVTAFRWAHHHEILWEENLEFAPPRAPHAIHCALAP